MKCEHKKKGCYSCCSYLVRVSDIRSFFNPIQSITCAGGICKMYDQKGTIGLDKCLTDEFRVADIKKCIYKTNVHKIKKRRSSYTTEHTDYTPYIILKNGRGIDIPIKFCRDMVAADTFIQKIRNNQYVKKQVLASSKLQCLRLILR